MKIVILTLALIAGFGVNSFAASIMDQPPKENTTSNTQGYKASPRLEYHKSTPPKPSPGNKQGSGGVGPGFGGVGNPAGQNNSFGSQGNDRRNY